MKFARWSIPTQLVAACFIYVTKRTRTSTASLTEQPERILTHHKNRRKLVKIKVHCNFPCSKSIGGGGQTFALKRRFCAPSVSYGRVDPFLWLLTSERKKAAFSDIYCFCLPFFLYFFFKPAESLWWCLIFMFPGHFSTITLDFTDRRSETELSLEAKGVPSGEEDRMKEGWQRYYFDAIKQTFGYGAQIC